MTRAAAFNDPFDLRPDLSNAVRLTNPGGADYRVVLRNIEARSTERSLRIANTVVLSLSENATSQMMWAHYTQGHTGLAIGFDPTLGLFAEDSPHRSPLLRVLYADERPSAASGNDLTNDQVLMTKSAEWEHEGEWRCVDSLFSASANESPDGVHWLFSIKPASVSRVLLGCRCGLAFEHEVMDVLREPRYAHVSLFRVDPDLEHYRLNVEEIRRDDW